MTAIILDGQAIAHQMKMHLKKIIKDAVTTSSLKPCLAVVLIGHHPASEIYVKRKQEACEQVGIVSFTEQLSEHITETESLNKIKALNDNPAVHGILVQLPLPPHLNPNTLLESLSPQKDVDGFHPYNLGRLAQSHPSLRPCTPFGVMKLLHAYKLSLKGKHAVIVGSSNIVGRPMALELLMAGCTITICHRLTQNLEQQVNQADILVSATGKRHVIQSHWIPEGCAVVDVGIHRLPSGKVMGDLDFDSAKERAGWITPVPGGVGPMTVATLLENTWKSYSLALQ